MESQKRSKANIFIKTLIIDIPYDCLAIITEFLTYKEVLLNFEFVCTIFYQASLLNHVWNCKLEQYLMPKEEFLDGIEDFIKMEVFDTFSSRDRFRILKTCSAKCRDETTPVTLGAITKNLDELVIVEKFTMDNINNISNLFTKVEMVNLFSEKYIDMCFSGNSYNYIGQICDGNPNGTGKCYMGGVLVYSGTFKQGTFIRGAEYHPNGKVKFYGVFGSGFRQLKGSLYDLDGNFIMKYESNESFIMKYDNRW